MRIEWDVPIAMDDGLVLRADVFRPVEDGPHPVLLTYGPYAKGLAFQDGYPSAWTIMAAKHPDVPAGSSNLYQAWEVVDPEKWVPHGYACVRVDSRGCGCSPGYIDHFGPREQKDYYDCIEWAAAQTWSSGKVGLNGVSYFGSNQWHVAKHRPPHLAALCIWEGSADWYRDMTHHGGILSTFWANWYDMQVKTVQYGAGERGRRSRAHGGLVCGPETLNGEELAANRCDFGADIRAHPLDDSYHRDRSPVWADIDVPFLSAANWGGQGLHPRGNFEAFMRAASPDKWLEVHGIEHWTHFYTDYGRDLQRRFFDHFLKGLDNGWDREPRVLLQIRHPGERFEPRAEHEWPLARTAWTKFYLDGSGDALVPAPPSGTSAFLPPRRGGPTPGLVPGARGGAAPSPEKACPPPSGPLGLPPPPPVEENAPLPPSTEGTRSFEALGDGLTFLTPPLEQTTEITGPIAAKLFVSSASADADLFLVLRVFGPDMKEVTFQGAIDPHTPVAQGWLRASHRKLDPELTLPYRPYHAHDERQPLTPGEPVELDIEIWPTCIVVPAGHRIGLSVRGCDYVYPGGSGGKLSNFKNELTGCGPFLHDDPLDRPPELFAGRTTLHLGPTHPSYVLLPIIPVTV